MQEIKVGSEVYILIGDRVQAKCTVARETNHFWYLNQIQRLGGTIQVHKKNLSLVGYRDHTIALCTDELANRLSEQKLEARRLAEAHKRKSKLSDYLDYLEVGYMSRVDDAQITEILDCMYRVIGEIKPRY